MVGGIINQKKLTNEEMKLFLSDIKKLKNPEMLKCGAKYVIRINLKNDTLRLKEYGYYISNRFRDLYYTLPNNENLIDKYWKK